MSPRVSTVARWTVALAAIAVLVSLVDIGDIRARLAGTDPRLAIPAVLGLVLVHMVAASAWRRLLRDLEGVRLDWARTLRLYYSAQVFGTITPANVGADVYRVVAVGGSMGRAQLARPVLMQRLTSVLAIVCLGVAGGLVLPIPWLRPFLVLAALVGAIIAAASVAIVRPVRASGWIGSAARRLGWTDDPGTHARRLRSALRDGFGLGLVFHGLSLALGLLLVRSVDENAAGQPWLVLGALAVARLSLAVPVSPNGIGIQEGLLAVLFVQLGLPAETAIAAALLNRLGFLLTAGIGALALASPRRPRRVAVTPPAPPTARSAPSPHVREGRPITGC